jgi:hypothetical protein
MCHRQSLASSDSGFCSARFRIGQFSHGNFVFIVRSSLKSLESIGSFSHGRNSGRSLFVRSSL